MTRVICVYSIKTDNKSNNFPRVQCLLRESDLRVNCHVLKRFGPFRQVCYGFALCCASFGWCSGQTDLRTGLLTGIVLDPSGARVAHASVRLCSVATDCSAAPSVLTDDSGRFSSKVRAGTYDLVVDSPGFVPAERNGVAVAFNGSVELTLKLTIAVRPESVDVAPNASLTTNASDNRGAQIFDEERLAELSNDDATFQQQLNVLAGADPSHPAEILVDGFSGGRIPPKSTIREVRINQNPYSAQFPGYGMNRIEITTKPGGGQFHGSLQGQGYDGNFNGDNPYAGVEPPYYSYRLDGQLSGPLDKRTSFFAAGFLHDMENNAAVDAVNPATFASLSEAVRAPDRSHDVSARIDRQASASNTLTLRYELNGEKIANNGVGLLVLPSEGYDSSSDYQTVELSDTEIASAKVVNEARFQYVRTRVQQNAAVDAPTVIVEGTFNGGGSSVGTLHDNQDRYEFQDLISVDLGKHFVRTGMQDVLLRDANESTANYNQTFTFSDLTSYQMTLAGNTIQQIQAVDPNASTQYLVTQGAASATVSTSWLGAYAEDEWKAAKNLTLNYGLRLESQTAIPDHADWAPRAGFAWGVGQRDKKAPLAVVRGGLGVFYDRFAASNLLTAVRDNGVSQQSYFVENPAICPTNSGSVTNPVYLCQALTAQAPTTYSVSPRLRSEYAMYWSVGLDRVFGRLGSVSINYVGEREVHQFLSRNINAPLPGTYNAANPASAVYPLGGTQAVYQFASDGVTKGQQLTVYTALRLTSKARLYARYWFQQENSDTSGATNFPSNEYDLGADYGRATDNHRNRIYAGGSYALPLGVNLSPTLVVGSGAPFNITTGTDLNGDTIYNDRPAFATDLSRASVVQTAYGNFDTQPIAGQKIIPRNYDTGPGYAVLFASLSKTVGVGPRKLLPAEAGKPATRADRPYSLRFGVESENVLNHVNRGLPVGVLNSPLFGKSISLTPIYTENQAVNRVVTLSTTFSF